MGWWQDIEGAVSAPVTVASDTVDTLTSVGRVFAFIGEKAFWIRTGIVIGGFALMGVGVFLVFHKQAGGLVESAAKIGEVAAL